MMHVSCLGILQYLTGNVMWELLRGLGGTKVKWTNECGILLNMAKSQRQGTGPEDWMPNVQAHQGNDNACFQQA